MWHFMWTICNKKQKVLFKIKCRDIMLNLSDFSAFLAVDYIKYFSRVRGVAKCPKILP